MDIFVQKEAADKTLYEHVTNELLAKINEDHVLYDDKHAHRYTIKSDWYR